MSSISDILKPIEPELTEFHLRFSSYLENKSSLLEEIIRYILQQKGKRIRPALVLLSAKLTGGVNDRSYRGAILVELLHTATLVHDDVVDDADMRRAVPSINALWKNKVAVLIGDYLLSRGLLLSLDHGDYDQLTILSRAVRDMSEGELVQIEKSRMLNTTEDVYFRIIQGKTGSLISSGCEIGALSNTTSPEVLERLRTIGSYLGIAFQIRDDLLDFTEGGTGKPAGLDLKEKKMTLPLIYALANTPADEQNRIRRKIRLAKKVADFEEIRQFIIDKKGIEYGHQVAGKYAQLATDELMTFPASEARDAFTNLIRFIVNRSY